jgi:hypothetical protein
MASDAALLEEIRDRHVIAAREWAAILDEARTDRLCVAGDPWQALDPHGKKQRTSAKRPCLASDELNQYINQAVNGVRANPRAIHFAPTGNGANDKGAEFYENHTREIEYRSHAQMAYCTAFADAVTSSIGWLVVRAKREHPRTFNQNLWIEPVVNPDQVLPGPNGVWPDGRDLKYLFYLNPFTLAEFNRQFPKATRKSFGAEARGLAPGWIARDTGLGRDLIYVAEYWTLRADTRKLIAFRPTGMRDDAALMALEDELPDGKLPEGMENIREEDVDDERVEACLTNGFEILDEIPWQGRHLPFVSCRGKALYVDDGGAGSSLRLLSLTRLARDPYMLYCYMVSSVAEAIGGVTRSSYIAYEGQIVHPDLWAKAAHEPVPVLTVRERTEITPPTVTLPLPQKQSWDPPLENVEAAKEGARRAIQAAMGILPQATPMQEQQDQRSGVAHQQIESGSQRGAFHFVDNYDLMIERVGIILEEQIELRLDTKRKVPVREAVQGKGSDVTINDPSDPDGIFTKGDYRVTVSTGPATESQRVEAAEFVDGMVGALSMIAQIAGAPDAKKLLAKSIKLKNLGPIGEEIVDLLDPPPPPGPNGKPLPPEMQALMGKLQQAQQQIQQLTQQQQTESLKYQSAEKIKTMDLTFQREKLERDSETKLAVAELSAKVDRIALFLEERDRMGLRVQGVQDKIHEAREAVKDRLHEVVLASGAHHSDMIQQTQAHQHGLEAGAVAHQQALEAQPPDAGVNGNGT